MRKPNVFVVNEPLQRDPGSGEMTRKIDLRPAEEYGELVFLSAPGNPPRDPSFSVRLMRERLQSARPGDYLLLVGHPLLICIAGALIPDALKRRLGVLLWDRVDQAYRPVHVDLLEQEKAA